MMPPDDFQNVPLPNIASSEVGMVEGEAPANRHESVLGKEETQLRRRPDLPLYNSLVNDAEVRDLIELADEYLKAIGYTDHGIRHVGRVAMRAAKIIRETSGSAHEEDLAATAGLLHDIGNLVHRSEHDQSSALIAFDMLRARGVPLRDVARVCGAIGNHDEHKGEPVSNVSAALIIADKTDVLRSRVRTPELVHFDIHDRVNYAATRSALTVEAGRHLITLALAIDTNVASLVEYFEIFLTRMTMSRRASTHLNCDFRLIINDTILM